MKTKREGISAVAVVTAALVVLSLVGISRVAAQGQAHQFKVGDRVEVDTFMRGDYPGSDKMAKWRTGTVVRLDKPEDRFGAYIVKVDESGGEMRVRFVDSRWIRTPQGADAKAADETKAGGNTRPNQAIDARIDQIEIVANQTKEFKVGDRVEIDVLQISNSSPAEMQKWKAGTVTEIDRRPGYRPVYIVQVDPIPGQLPQNYRIPITPNIAERVWIRAGGGAAPNIPTDKLRVDANDTVLAEREVLDCQHLEQPSARNGSPLPADLAKKLIRCAMGENPSPAGGQGATQVDISQFAIGAPRRWDLNRDTGFGGTADTIVYPVRVKFTKKTFYREQNTLITDREQLFACHVDLGKWICGPDQVLKEGEKTQIQVKK
jgi:hypothetical protein